MTYWLYQHHPRQLVYIRDYVNQSRWPTLSWDTIQFLTRNLLWQMKPTHFFTFGHPVDKAQNVLWSLWSCICSELLLHVSNCDFAISVSKTLLISVIWKFRIVSGSLAWGKIAMKYFIGINFYQYRADSWFVPSQWATSLQSKGFSHPLGANLESALSIWVGLHPSYLYFIAGT